ncbi:hypothetical protein [Paraburkholderia unamae]|uniref:Uncharacterized protein n=1 Tax=Paraburkholderia unamae TaxID=219649 RepID=A0ACC6RH68_9BURK
MALTYSKLKEYWEGRRFKGRARRTIKWVGFNNCEVGCENVGGSTYITVYFHDHRIALFHADGRIMIDACGYESSPVTRARILNVTGIYLRSDSRKYRGSNKKVRIGDLPYTKGMWFLNGRCINPEICSETITTMDRSIVRSVAARLSHVTKLAITSTRMGLIDGRHAGIITMPELHNRIIEEGKSPTVDTVNMLAQYGCGSYYNPRHTAVYVRKSIDCIRERMYRLEGAYITREIEYGQQEKLAA